jgi:hypothetical protein
MLDLLNQPKARLSNVRDRGPCDGIAIPADRKFTRARHTDPERLDDARPVFEQMLGYADHLGLFAEQTGNSGEALGNFPKAFTHLGLISAAFNHDRALGAR